jgi:hypothetical protein
LPNRWREKLLHKPYNPLSRINLARSIADEMLTAKPRPLAPDKPFAGAGVYAVYFASDRGRFELYSRVNNFGLSPQSPQPPEQDALRAMPVVESALRQMELWLLDAPATKECVSGDTAYPA